MKLECLNKDVKYLCYFNLVNRSLNLSQESREYEETRDQLVPKPRTIFDIFPVEWVRPNDGCTKTKFYIIKDKTLFKAKTFHVVHSTKNMSDKKD